MRAHAGTVAAFLRDAPITAAALEMEERAAGEAHAHAEAALHAAEEELARVQERGSESARLEAARARQHARDAVEAAEARSARAREERERLDREAAERAAEADRLERRGSELALHARLEHDVAPPAT